MESQETRGSPILLGDCRLVMQGLEPESFHCCVTSPPYWGHRDYGIPPTDWPDVSYSPMPGLQEIKIEAWTGCLGMEPAPEMFVGHMVSVFREVWRVLRDDGTLWLNLGDTYISTAPGTMGDNIHIEGTLEATKRARKIMRRDKPTYLKQKDLVGIPWRVAFALQADGWYHRIDNIWNKLNCLPESVTDRPTKTHEYIFLLSKSKQYFYNHEAIKEPVALTTRSRISQDLTNQQGSERANAGSKTNGAMKAVGDGLLRNKRSVWNAPTANSSEAHFASYPPTLIEPCILAGSPIGGMVLDPFGGSGTTRKVALENNRECVLIELNPDYIEIEKRRTSTVQTNLF